MAFLLIRNSQTSQDTSARRHLAVHVWEVAVKLRNLAPSLNLNFKEQRKLGTSWKLTQMERDLPGQANAVNVRSESSILQGASMSVISGGEFNSFGGDYNPITINVYQDVQRHRDDCHESSLIRQGQQNLGRGRTPSVDHIVCRDLSDVQDEECVLKEQSSNAIYERQMLTRKRGFPLWIPQPNTLAPLMHRLKGVVIGDLGRVTEYGAFDVLFNICKAAGHPNNPDELPDGFEPLALKPYDIHRVKEYTPGSHIASASVKKPSAGLTFQCSSSEGAILIMPDGAFREDLRSITLFRDFAAENAESWYRFINGPCGWELGNGELRLITGCDKTTSWGIAACQNIQSEGDSSGSLGGSLLRFRNTSDAGDCVPGTTYHWEYEGTAEVKAGPEFEVDEDMPANGARSSNQCTFIRSHTIMLSEAGWARVQSTLVSALDSRRASKAAQPQSTNSSNFLINIFFYPGTSRSRHNAISAKMIDSHARLSDVHPSTFIAKILLQKYPDAKVAIVHDDHWGMLIGQNEEMPTGAVLWKRIQETFDIVLDCKGTIYLSKSDLAYVPLDHRPIRAESIVDAPNVEDVVNDPVTRHLQRLDGQIDITDKYPILCGYYADTFAGILRGGLDILGLQGVWTGKAISGRGVAVTVKTYRDAYQRADTSEARRKYFRILQREYLPWASLRHPNILPLIGLVDDPAIPSTGIVTPRCTFGDLRYFFSGPTTSGVVRLAIVKGIARGLSYLHEIKMVHGDIEMCNIYLDGLHDMPTPMISISGRSRVLETARYGFSNSGAELRHLPPEALLAENNRYTDALLTRTADVWCFGMVMLETLTGKKPFFHLKQYQAAAAVAIRKKKPNRNRYPCFPQDENCWEIMERCWHYEPSWRAEMHCLLQSLDAVL